VHVGVGRKEFICKTRTKDKTLGKSKGGFHTEILYAFCIYRSDKHAQYQHWLHCYKTQNKTHNARNSWLWGSNFLKVPQIPSTQIPLEINTIENFQIWESSVPFPKFIFTEYKYYRSQWPSALSRGSAAAHLLGLRVRITQEA